jgi:hypothetical protein
MDGAGPNVFERIEQKLSSIGVQVDNSDLHGAEKQVEESLEKNPADMESKLARLELKVVELARFLDAAVSALESHNGHHTATEEPDQFHATSPAPQQKQQQQVRKIKKLQQNPATGVIEEVEIDDNPADHFIVADGRSRFTASMDGKKDGKKSVFIAAADDEPVTASDKKMRK